MVRRKLLVLRFLEVSRSINPEICPPHPFVVEYQLLCPWSCLNSGVVGWVGLILECPDDIWAC